MKDRITISLEPSINVALDEMSRLRGVPKSQLIETFILKNLDLRKIKRVDEKYLNALNFFHLREEDIEPTFLKCSKMSYFLSSKAYLFKSVKVKDAETIEVILKGSNNVHKINNSFFKDEEDFLNKILEFMKIFDEEGEMEKEKEIKKLESELF